MPRALLSVSNKDGLVDFARGLAARGYQLLSTGGTASTLTAAGLDVVGVAEVTGFPEMLDGRVKTLHPAIHGGILARRSFPEDLEALSAHGIQLVDLVVVNLYPFVKAAANPSTSFDDLIEQIDIGGPSMVRAAAKNFGDVLVVVDPADYGSVLAALDETGGASRATRFALACKAFDHTASYDRAIATTLAAVTTNGDRLERGPSPVPGSLPDSLVVPLVKLRDLRYGENPHQKSALYVLEPREGLSRAEVVQGKELSYTNLLNVDSAARIAAEFDEPAAVVIKHTNPCGAAIGSSVSEAYLRARDADALAAFGGIVGLNRMLDEATARAIVSTFIEAVVAPDVAPAARIILSSKPNMRVVILGASDGAAGESGLELRSIVGAVLVQQRDRVSEARSAWPASTQAGLKVVTRRTPTADEWVALRFAWRICAHVKSNAVIFTSSSATLAVGAGQMSRVDAVKTAVMKAHEAAARRGSPPLPAPLTGSVAASDAFFPFRDGVDAVAAAGATAIVQPGGSMRDSESIEAADELGLAMVFTGHRHFRH